MTNFLIKVLVKLLLGLWLMARLAMGSFIIKIMRSPGDRADVIRPTTSATSYRTPRWRRYWTIVLSNNSGNLPAIIKIKNMASKAVIVKWNEVCCIYDNLYDCKQTTITVLLCKYLLKMEVLEFELCFYDSCGLHSCPQNILRGNGKLTKLKL